MTATGDGWLKPSRVGARLACGEWRDRHGLRGAWRGPHVQKLQLISPLGGDYSKLPK